MGNQWGDIYLCVPPTKMLGGRVPPVPSIIAAPATSKYACLLGTSDLYHVLVYV